MSRTLKKFIALILSAWLPLFSGNALAVSVAMYSMTDACHAVAESQDLSHAPCEATAPHSQPAVDGDQTSDHHDQAGCGICHLGSYLAVAFIGVIEAQPSSSRFPQVSARFHSVTAIPLDPPPLVRA